MTPGEEMISLAVPSIAQMHERRSAKWAAYPRDVISVALAEMDYPLAPSIMAVIHEATRRSDLGYVLATPARLATSFCNFCARRMNWTADPSGIELVPDVMTAVRAIAAQVLEPGERVVIPDLVYGPIPRDLRQLGFVPVPIALHRDGELRLASLRAEMQGGTRMLVLVNPSNPTGESFSSSDLARIAELCAEFEAWVISDEIHGPLTLPGAIHTPWLTCSPHAWERGFVLTGATKAFNVPALKAAFVVAQGSLARQVVRSMSNLSERASILGVLASQAAFEEGEEWLDAVLQQLASNCRVVDRAVGTLLPGIRWRKPEATYFAWLDCRRIPCEPSPETLFLERARVALSPGKQFGVGGIGHVRLNFATSEAHLQDALGRMSQVVGDLAGEADLLR